MSSVNGLLVPNNFDIFANSITTPGGGGSVTPDSVTTFTNKTITDASNTVAADQLYSGGKTNLIDVASGANPTIGQALVAISANAADWQDVTARNLFSGGATNTISIGGAPNPTAGQILTATSPTAATWQDPALGPGVIAQGQFTGSTVSSLSYQDVGPEIGLGTTNGTFLFICEVLGIKTDGTVIHNGQSVASFKVQGGIPIYSDPPGSGWTRYSTTATTPIITGKWKIGSGAGAQFEATVNGDAVDWQVNYRILFKAL